MTNPPVPATPLDVEACVRLLTKIADALAESARHIKSEMESELCMAIEGYRDDLAKEFAEDDGDAKLARALASALPGMGKEIDALRAELEMERRKDHAYASWTNGYNAAIADYVAGRTAQWPARAAQPQETSADAT